MIIIPTNTLSEHALHGLIDEFVTRDGTDYGAIEQTRDAKIAQVKTQLKQGLAVIVFDDTEQTVHIIAADSMPAKEK